jgi:hypothetical protein
VCASSLTTTHRVRRNHGSHFEKNKIAFQEGAADDVVIMDDDEEPQQGGVAGEKRESSSVIDEKLEKV